MIKYIKKCIWLLIVCPIGFLFENFIKWLNRRKYFGAFRFRLTRFIYRIWPGYPAARNMKWDFILSYLPPLRYVYWVGLRVLDIGCVDTLLIYEIAKRGYWAYGLDVRDYQAKLPSNIGFFKCNIIEDLSPELSDQKFDYIIANAIIDLVGTDKYGDGKVKCADRKALENIHKLLKDTGYFILFLPILNWRFINGRGYTLGDIHKLIDGLFCIFEITQRNGNICLALVKIFKNEEGKVFLTTFNE